MIAVDQGLGHLPIAEDARPGEAGVVVGTIFGEGVLDRAFDIAQSPRLQTHHRINQGESGGFAAAQDEIAERERLWMVELGNALIDTLVMTAQDGDGRSGGQLAYPGLVEAAPLRAGDEQAGARFTSQQVVEGARHWWRCDDHPRSAAERSVVHLLVTPFGPPTRIDEFDLDQTASPRPTNDASI